MAKKQQPHEKCIEISKQITATQREITKLQQEIVDARNKGVTAQTIVGIRRNLDTARAELEELELQLIWWRKQAQCDEARMHRLRAMEHIESAFDIIGTWAEDVARLETAARDWSVAFMALRGTRERVIAELKAAGVDQRVLGLVIDEAAVDAHVGNALLALRGVSWYRGGEMVNREVSGADALRRHSVALQTWLKPLVAELTAPEVAPPSDPEGVPAEVDEPAATVEQEVE